MRRNDSTSFDHGQEIAQRTAKQQLKIIVANILSLSGVRGGDKLIKAARSFYDMTERKEKLSPNQLSFVDNIYEKLMASKGFESCNLHIDRKRKGLRF